MAHTNNVFELISLRSVRRRTQGSNFDSVDDSSVITEDEKKDLGKEVEPQNVQIHLGVNNVLIYS